LNTHVVAMITVVIDEQMAAGQVVAFSPFSVGIRIEKVGPSLTSILGLAVAS